MELDDLKQAWTRMQWRQDDMQALLQEELRERSVGAVRSIVRRSLLARAVELAAWIAFTMFAASFWVANRHVPHWLIIGLLLHVYGVAGIWACAAQMALLARIRLFDAPVVTLQRRLAQLGRLRVWCTLSLGLPWWCLWLLVPLVLARWFTGVDWLEPSADWFWANMAVGVTGMAGSVWLVRHLAGRPVRAAWLQRIIDDMSGCNLRRASRQLDELARFERE